MRSGPSRLKAWSADSCFTERSPTGTRSARLSSRRLQPANPGNTNGGSGNILQCLFCVRSGPNGIVHNYVEDNQTAFVQDDWKINSRLTFNLGVRWEYDGSYSDKYGNLTNFWLTPIRKRSRPSYRTDDFRSRPGGLCGAQQLHGSLSGAAGRSAAVTTAISQSKSGPPLGQLCSALWICVAAQKDGKLVIRGGVGMFYDRIGGGTFVHGLEQGYPYAVTLDYSGSRRLLYDNRIRIPSTPLGMFASRWVNFGGCQPSCLHGAPNSDLEYPVSGSNLFTRR